MSRGTTVAQVKNLLAETLGMKLRRLARFSLNNNAWTRPYMIGVPAWQPNTAYVLGDMVSNLGNVYVNLYTSGTSAASGGPTRTDGYSNTDGTVSWYYFCGDQATGANTYEVPSYVSQITAPGTLFNIYNPQSASGLAAIKFRGCYAGPTLGTNFVRAYVFTPTAGATPLMQHTSHEFMTDAPKFYVMQTNGAPRMLVIINGMRFNLAPTNSNASGNTYHVFDFSGAGGRKVRKIRIETMGTNVGQIGVDGLSQVWAPDDSDKITVACISDSIWQGSNYGPFVVGNSLTQRLGHELGWNDVWSFTQGGTGYVNRGTGAGVTTDKFSYRITEAATRSPDLWLLMGSTNDLASGATAVTAAALATFQAIRAVSSAPIIVLGVLSINDSAQAAANKVAVIETAVQSAVTSFADAKTFFIPIRNDAVFPWISGTWNNTRNANSANAVGAYIGGDNIHPLDAGSLYLSHRIARAIRHNVLPNLK